MFNIIIMFIGYQVHIFKCYNVSFSSFYSVSIFEDIQVYLLWSIYLIIYLYILGLYKIYHKTCAFIYVLAHT